MDARRCGAAIVLPGGSPRRRPRTSIAPAGQEAAGARARSASRLASGRARRMSSSRARSTWSPCGVQPRAPPRSWRRRRRASRQGLADPLGAPAARARACPRRSAGRSARRRARPASIRRLDRGLDLAVAVARGRFSQAASSARSAPCGRSAPSGDLEGVCVGPPSATAAATRPSARAPRASGSPPRPRSALASRPAPAGGGGPLDAEGLEQLRLDLAGGLGVLGQVLLGVVAALAEPQLAVGEERARLLDQVVLQREVEQAALVGDPGPVLDVELGLAEGRRDLVLDHLHPDPVADRLGALLEGLDAADVEPLRGVELQRPAARLGLRASRS